MWWLWWVSGHTGMDKAVDKVTTGERREAAVSRSMCAPLEIARAVDVIFNKFSTNFIRT